MGCIVLEGPAGKRKVPEGEPYQRLVGEEIVGVDWDCKGAEQRDVEAELERQGVAWGDAIAWVTKRLGVKQCAPCKARQEILNHAKELGWGETLRQIRETF